MQEFSDKTLRLESISLLISAVLRFSREIYFIKAIENIFPVFAWPDINTRGVGMENSRQLCKPSTSSRVCVTVSNSPNPSRVYIRVCKHGKRFLLLKQGIQSSGVPPI